MSVTDGSTGAYVPVHVGLVQETHDARALPLYTQHNQTPSHHGACLWCKMQGHDAQNRTCYPCAVALLPVRSPLRKEWKERFADSTDAFRGPTAFKQKAPSIKDHLETLRLMDLAEQAFADLGEDEGEGTKKAREVSHDKTQVHPP
jgi:hypothetical protein